MLLHVMTSDREEFQHEGPARPAYGDDYSIYESEYSIYMNDLFDNPSKTILSGGFTRREQLFRSLASNLLLSVEQAAQPILKER